MAWQVNETDAILFLWDFIACLDAVSLWFLFFPRCCFIAISFLIWILYLCDFIAVQGAVSLWFHSLSGCCFIAISFLIWVLYLCNFIAVQGAVSLQFHAVQGVVSLQFHSLSRCCIFAISLLLRVLFHCYFIPYLGVASLQFHCFSRCFFISTLFLFSALTENSSRDLWWKTYFMSTCKHVYFNLYIYLPILYLLNGYEHGWY